MASIILLDQIPRNMYRGTAKMFQFDGLAREAVNLFLSNGGISSIRPAMKIFAYMPFEHHENLESQKRCLEELEKALNEPDVDETERELIDGAIKYSKLHLEVIKKFGRFPHRNILLNRKSTAEEVEFLKSGPTF